jgi:hypothetical protein
MKKLLVAAALAGFALSAAAYDSDTVTVSSTDDCPAGTAATVASYKWQDHHFVRNGWVCKSIYSDR